MMAIDTENKRRSTQGLLAGPRILPVPDSTIEIADRVHVWLYRGISLLTVGDIITATLSIRRIGTADLSIRRIGSASLNIRRIGSASLDVRRVDSAALSIRRILSDTMER